MSERNMQQDLFRYLPSEITLNILTRLPVVTVVQCKLVCKPWRDLIKTSEFAKLHLSKSVPGLAVFRDFSYGIGLWPKPYKFYEYIDMKEAGRHHCSEVFSFSSPLHEQHICSSVNGLLFLSDKKESPRHHFICNPITRDYMMLPRPDGPPSYESKLKNSFGFGVSKTSGQYKVVTLFHDINRNQTKCQVYTLGAGSSWRNIEPQPLRYAYDDLAVFWNGNLYWIVRNMSDDSYRLACFDLETEEFHFWSLPPDLLGMHTSLAAMEQGLIVCDGLLQHVDDNVIWLMTEDGDEKYWVRKFVITSSSCYGEVKNGTLCPIKVFADGNILLAQPRASKLMYSKNPDVYHPTDVALYDYDRVLAVSYTPSFISLFFHSQPSYWRM